jgi:predicted nucleic acid-binding protein
MATRIFIDTNIFLDLLDNQRQYHKEAVLLFELIDNGEVMAFFSESVVATTDYILQKLLSKDLRTAFFGEISRKIQMLPCSNMILDRAVSLEFEDLEDVILFQLALENKVDFFITNDKFFLNSTLKGIQLIQAGQFLNIKSM